LLIKKNVIYLIFQLIKMLYTILKLQANAIRSSIKKKLLFVFKMTLGLWN